MSGRHSETIDEIVLLMKEKDLSPAMDKCRSLLDSDPDCAPAVLMMSIVAMRSGDEGTAINLAERAHKMEPDYRDYAVVLAFLCVRVGRINDALYYAKLARALEPHPDYANLLPYDLPDTDTVFEHSGLSLHYLIAESAFAAGDFQTAIQQGESELRINPGDTDCIMLLARTELILNRPERALSHLRAAVHLQPGNARIHLAMADALLARGEHDAALAAQKLAARLEPENSEIASHILAALPWQTDGGHASSADLIASSMRRIEKARTPRQMEQTRGPYVGILWDQCRSGPAMDFVLPVLQHLENVILYRLNHRGDGMTEAVRSTVLRFQDCQDMDAATLDRIIAGDRPSVLINLCAGGEELRIPLLSGATAPISLQWLNYPMPDRLPATEFIVSSTATSDLDVQDDQRGKLIKLPQLLAYRFPGVDSQLEAISPSPREAQGYVTFGAVGDMRRITADTIALWSGALLSVPGSYLNMGSTSDWQQSSIDRILALFSNFGLVNRIRFQRAVDNHTVNLDFFRGIDILLDTAPVTGLNDVAEALWMGVPAVTLKGSRRAGRTGAAVLHAAGRHDWIADSPDAYAFIAKRLAEETDLVELRARLRIVTSGSSLCDTKNFAVALYNAATSKAANYRSAA